MTFNHDPVIRVVYVHPESPEERRRLQRLPFPYVRPLEAWAVPEAAWTALEEMGPPDDLIEDLTAPPEGDLLHLASLPDTLRLFPFQQEDAARMVDGPWGLWWDMGLGKGVATLAAYHVLRERGSIDGMVVLGPDVAKHVWTGEDGLPNQFLGEVGFEVKTGSKQEPPRAGILFMTYAKTFREPYYSMATERLKTGRWALVLDEAHLVSGALSRRFRSVELWSRLARWRWALSGTPVSNYPDTFWAVYALLTRASITREKFSEWFGNGSGRWSKRRLEGLGKVLRADSSRRSKAEVAPQLPPRTTTVLKVALTGRQRDLYTDFIREGRVLLATYAGEKWLTGGYGTLFEHFSKLRSLASHPGLLGEDVPPEDLAKHEVLQGLLETVGEQKVCVWSWRPWVLDWLRAVLGEQTCVRYHGKVSPGEKTEAVHRFQHDPEVRLFLGNPSAAGTALSLGAGSVAVYWDLGWSWVEFSQAGARIDRITRTLPITEFVLVAEDTIEEFMWGKIQEKVDLQEILLSGDRRSIGSVWGWSDADAILRGWKG